MLDIAQSEHDIQSTLIEWATWNSHRYPELSLLFAIPNGGIRDAITGKRLKEEGVKKGVPDLLLPIPKQNYHGLFIEMKRPKAKLSPVQKQWHDKLLEQGYQVKTCYSTNEASATIKEYLEID